MSPWLEGKTAIITGAGRGIGRAAAMLLVAEGARVFLNDLEAAPLAETVSAIRAAKGTAESLVGDLTAPGLPERIIQSAREAFGVPDIIVNNAGFTWDGTLHKMTDAQWDAMLAIHLTVPFRLLRAAAPLMREAAKREIAESGRAGARKIVNISSTSGTRGNFGQANYAAAKAGIIGLTKTLAREWGPLNIQVNCAAFGTMDTRLTREKESGEKLNLAGREIALGVPAAMREAAIKMIPMGRPGTAIEAARVILFFASPLSDYVSGQVLEVTGGL
jgi:3-oxoacyl-[acyl-carrier protein] reductase